MTTVDRPEIVMSQISAQLWIAELRGEHDASTCADLRRELDRALAAGAGIVVDLSAAASIDSSVIAELVRARQRAESTPGAALAVVAPANSPAGIVFDLVDDNRKPPTFASRRARNRVVRSEPADGGPDPLRPGALSPRRAMDLGRRDRRPPRGGRDSAARVFRELANSRGEGRHRRCA